MEFNDQELKLGFVYKSTAFNLLATDIDRLLDSRVSTIFAGDLYVRIPARNSSSINSAGRTLFTHMENNDYSIMKIFINWNWFTPKLHKTISKPNPSIDSKVSLDTAVINIVNKFQEALVATSTVISIDIHKYLPAYIRITLTTKRHLRRQR